MTTSKEFTTVRLTPNAALLKMITGLVVSTILITSLVFFSAGRVDWVIGWVFSGAWFFLKLIFTLLLRWRDPDLLVERMTRHENTQRYDRVLLPTYYVLAFGTILLSSLDGGRFHWSGNIPIIIIIFAYIINLAGNLLAAWAVNTNTFFSAESRLQTDRNQRVVRDGPYHYVRHPAYLAAIILWLSFGLMLASWWAVIPGLLTALSMLIRTFLEDRMLQASLPGYTEYCQQVRYRLIPGIW